MEKFLARVVELKKTQSTAAFAKSIGIPQQTMDRYLKGRTPPIDVVRKLCLVYGVSSDWLLGIGDGQPPRPAASIPSPTAGMNCETCKYKRLAEALKAVQAD